MSALSPPKSRAAAVGLLILAFLLALGALRFKLQGPNTDVFLDLVLVETAKDFPERREEIDLCADAQKETGECRNYFRVARAKARLFSQGEARALDTALQAIRHDCGEVISAREANEDTWARCSGGLISLYFFASVESDQKVLEFFEKNPSLLRFATSGQSMAWFYNRPHRDQWCALFEAAVIRPSHQPGMLNPFCTGARQRSFRVELM